MLFDLGALCSDAQHLPKIFGKPSMEIREQEGKHNREDKVPTSLGGPVHDLVLIDIDQGI